MSSKDNAWVLTDTAFFKRPELYSERAGSVALHSVISFRGVLYSRQLVGKVFGRL